MTDVRDKPVRTDEAQALVTRPVSDVRGRSGTALRAREGMDAPAPDLAPALDPFPFEPKRRVNWAVIISLILIVVAPVTAGGVYLFAFASDQYVAETRFAVRKTEAPSSNDGLSEPSNGSGSGSTLTTGSLMSGGAALVSEDAEVVANYIHSRSAIEDVSRVIDIRAIFQRPEADLLMRLPSDASAEALTRYWNRMVKVYVESTSGIVSVSVNAFRRDDALALTRAILSTSENLANSLTLAMRADQIKLAEDEVKRSEDGVRTALKNLTDFRNSERLIDPVENSQSTGKLLYQLIADRITTEGQLYVMQRSQGANAPGIGGVKARLDSINQNIAKLQNQLAGQKEVANLAGTLSRFEELEVKKEFAEKIFDFSRQGLERARLAAMGQAIYLAVFMQPSLPQDSTYPERFTDFFLVLLAAVMTWVSGATITASVLDHRL